MKKWREMNILVVMIFTTVLISACTSLINQSPTQEFSPANELIPSIEKETSLSQAEGNSSSSILHVDSMNSAQNTETQLPSETANIFSDPDKEFENKYVSSWALHCWYEHNVSCYDDILSKYPSEYASLWWGRGMALESENRYQEAVESYDRALSLYPKLRYSNEHLLEIYIAKSNSQRNLDEFNEAELTLDKARALLTYDDPAQRVVQNHYCMLPKYIPSKECEYYWT